jgi:hypothetical protein
MNLSTFKSVCRFKSKTENPSDPYCICLLNYRRGSVGLGAAMCGKVGLKNSLTLS